MSKIFGQNSNDSFILNFNYTPIVKWYSDYLQIKHLKIHGDIEDIYNPVIIGYGDDYHEDFQNFKNLNNNRIFDFSKSTWYLKTSNYHSFINWLNNQVAKFHVHVIGHSCGLTDRVLLKMIFEHKQCERIWIHYYPDQAGFLETAINISRHFDHPEMYRERMTSFDKNSPCPQMQDQFDNEQ